MNVTAIEILRDGGTIRFRVESDKGLSGHYRLQTPFKGVPRPIFRNEVQLDFGSADESRLASVLKDWLDETLTVESKRGLDKLGELQEFRNLPEQRSAALPLYRIQTVIECLVQRQSTD
ncbi:MAG: hypothetical protein AAGE65_10760 [Planctomycetota bacterium]